jgi:hypothetical protein
MLHRATRAGIEARPRSLLAGPVDEWAQRLGGLRMQWDAALGVTFADRDPQPSMPVGIGIEAFDGQAADLVTSCTAPPGHNQRGPLVGIGELVDGGHQDGELVVGDEPRQRVIDLWDVGG